MIVIMFVRSKGFRIVLFVSFAIACVIFAVSHPTVSLHDDPIMVRYVQAKERLTRLTLQSGEDVALQEFRRTIAADPELSNMCHPLAHEVGHAAYARDGLKALDQNDDICGSGYMHGIIESHFLQVTDIKKEMKKTCARDAGKCFHGLGHGVMYATEDDVPQSVSLCKKLDVVDQQNQCLEGVFMELFETDLRSHPTKYLDISRPFYPCNVYTGNTQKVCAFYAPRWYLRLHEGQYTQSLDWCMQQHVAVRSACIRGVGSVAMKDHMATPLFAHDICMQAAPTEKQDCIAGMAGYYIVHYASADRGKELCVQLPLDDLRTCLQVVKDSQRYYPSPR